MLYLRPWSKQMKQTIVVGSQLRPMFHFFSNFDSLSAKHKLDTLLYRSSSLSEAQEIFVTQHLHIYYIAQTHRFDTQTLGITNTPKYADLAAAARAAVSRSIAQCSAGRNGWRHHRAAVFPIIVAAKCYRLAPPTEAGPRGLAVWCSFHTWRCGVRIPGGSDTFLNAIGELFSIAVGFRSGKVRVG